MVVVPLVIMTLAASTLVVATPDWTDCPTQCRCKWISNKKTATCKDAGFSAVPTSLDGEMQVIDLSGNTIPRLERDIFQNAGLLNLQRIYMQNAGVRDVHRDAFRNLIILVEVDLSFNQIHILHPDTFRGNERLRIIYLNGNHLKKLVDSQFPQLPHLRTLEFVDCGLEYVHRNAFQHLAALETVSLKHNALKNLSEAAFMNFAHLKTLHLDENPWQCDCNLRGFRDWFLLSKLQSVPLICNTPQRLQGATWSSVSAEEFACAPHVSIHPRAEKVRAEAGGNVTFGCRVTGDPEPQVQWLYEGRTLNQSGLIVEAEEGLLDKWANVSVFNVSESDAGLYTCVATNVLDTVSLNLSLVLPEVVTATTLSKSETGFVWWLVAVVGGAVAMCGIAILAVTACCAARRRDGHEARRRRATNSSTQLKTSISFTDQEKKLLDVSIATTTDRGAGSCEGLSAVSELELLAPPAPPPPPPQPPPLHITIESEPLNVYPPPPLEFGGLGSLGELPQPYGNIFISVSVSREPVADAASRGCPDLLDHPHNRVGIGGGGVGSEFSVYHGMATLPRRPPPCAVPHYDNMGPRVTAGGGSCSTLSLAGGGGGGSEVAGWRAGKIVIETASQQTFSVQEENQEQLSKEQQKTSLSPPEFVSL